MRPRLSPLALSFFVLLGACVALRPEAALLPVEADVPSPEIAAWEEACGGVLASRHGNRFLVGRAALPDGAGRDGCGAEICLMDRARSLKIRRLYSLTGRRRGTEWTLEWADTTAGTSGTFLFRAGSPDEAKNVLAKMPLPP